MREYLIKDSLFEKSKEKDAIDETLYGIENYIMKSLYDKYINFVIYI